MTTRVVVDLFMLFLLLLVTQMIRMMVPKSLGRHIMCIFADSKDDENYYVKVLDKMKVSDLRVRGVNWNRLFKSGETTFLLLFLILLLLLFMTTIVVPKV